MLIKTRGIQFDDRLRKEALSLVEAGHEVGVGAIEDLNRDGETLAYNRIPTRTFALRSRDLAGSGRLLAIKSAEAYARFLFHILRVRPDVVWLHDVDLAGMMIVLYALCRLMPIRRVIWDQHELPGERVLRNRLLARVFEALMLMADRVVVANEARRTVLLTRYPRLVSSRVFVVRNYPDNEFRNLPRTALPRTVEQWVGSAKYILAQGGGSSARNYESLVAAIMARRCEKLIVVGPISKPLEGMLRQRYGDDINYWILHYGPVPQLELHSFIDHASASAIFYRADSSNALYCEANRLYQAVTRKTPVVVGDNPPLLEFVAKHRCGVVIKGDGRDAVEIQHGLACLEESREELVRNCEAASAACRWDEMFETVAPKVLGSQVSD